MVLVIDRDIIENIPMDKQGQLIKLLTPDIARIEYKCDAYILAKVDNEHESQKNYWRSQFGTDRNSIPKGMLRINEEVSFIGELVGGNIRSGKFEFVTEDESISGKATKAVKEKFKAHPLGGKFKASFEKVSFTNISKIVWTLVDIEDI